MAEYTIYIDGASRNNPGPAALGVVIEKGKGEVVDEYAEHIGETTNNVAEYTALIRGLERAKRLGAKEVQVYSDSQLMVRQLNGQYRVKAPTLRGLFIAAQALAGSFRSFRIEHIRREKNKRADALANQALDNR